MIRLKICHRTLLRFGCILLSVVLLGGTVTVWCGPGQQIAVSVPEASAGGVRLNDAFDLAVQAAGSVPYVADASMDELRGIITYAVGGNPTEGKALDEAGQNTKNNVAISLLWLFKSLKGVYSMRCKSSRKARRANSRTFSFSAQGLSVYGACATSEAMSRSAA